MRTAPEHAKPVDQAALPSDGPDDLRQLLRAVLTYARERDYAGWDYVDGMSSRFLRSLPVESKWLNIAVQETVKRAPVNLRPLFRVEQRRNFKGVALFAMANLTADRTLGDGRVDYRAEARELLDWLVDNRSVGYSGFCGGHQHPIQWLDHREPVNDPDLVSTAYAVRALLRGDAAGVRTDDECGQPPGYYARVARTAADWAVDDMDYREVDGGAIITYYPKHPDDSYTLNAGAVGASMFLDLFEHFGDEGFRRCAERLLAYIATKQTPAGGWYYRVPADASHLSMDNHHNGFIVEAFQRYRAVTGERRFDETLDRALAFYRETLFDAEGAPNFDEERAYPRDVHAAAQGILVFTYAGDHEFARRVLAWTQRHLFDGTNAYHFRKHRHYTTRITLMRWCQAWMAFALSERLAAVEDVTPLAT